MDHNIVKMLDSLTDTGIYVITEDTHKVLYFNERVREVAPFIKLGMVCHEIWSGSCSSCPLLTIGSKESSHSINYNDPFGNIVDITASRMMWNEKIPAFVIVVSAHRVTIDEIYSEMEILQMAKAVTVIYPLMISLNLTKGTYDFMEYRNLGEKKKREQKNFESLINSMLPQIYAEHREMFLEYLDEEYMRNHFNSEQNDYDFEFLKLNEEGEFRWSSIRVIRMDNVYNDDLILVILCRDIDKQKKRIQTLEERNEEMLLAVRNLYLSIMNVNLTNGMMRFLRVAEDNQEMKLLTKDYTEVLKKLAWERFYPDDQERMIAEFSLESLVEKINDGQGRYSEEYRRKRNGEWRWVSCTAFFARQDAEEKNVTIVLQDVHEAHEKREALAREEKQREEENSRRLKEALEAAKKASDAKSDFLSRMSHDIRTPMNAIIGMAALAEHYLEDHDRMRECIRKINVSSQHMMELINEVLDMNKIEHGSIELTEEEFQLSGLIQSVLAILRPMTEQKEQEVKVEVIGVEHEYLFGDRPKLQQIFNNILSNANKYTPNGGTIRLKVEELEPLSRQRGQFRFTFEDSGIGMSEEFLPKLFDPFTRADDSRISKINGSGLGMAITWNLVRLMSGDVRVKSKWGEGTTFILTLALQFKEEKSTLIEELMGKRILVVDDDRNARQNLCGILEHCRIQTEIALDPLKALVMIKNTMTDHKPYDAIIVDKTLPGMDGIELVREIRKLCSPKETAIILCSYDCSAIAGEAQRAGADEFLTKPLFQSHVEEVLGMLGKKKSCPVHFKIPQSFDGKKILLVEDNELNQEIASELLQMMGLTIVTADNGKIAVEMFEQSALYEYQLIFMDIQMPELNGYQAANAIRGLKREDAAVIPIIAMTADAFSDDVQRALNAGMNEHVSKPINRMHIQTVLEQWL